MTVGQGHAAQGRHWHHAIQYGFVSTGGGAWYTQTLHMLKERSRIWVNVPRFRYTAVGIVEEPVTSVRDFGEQLPDYVLAKSAEFDKRVSKLRDENHPRTLRTTPIMEEHHYLEREEISVRSAVGSLVELFSFVRSTPQNLSCGS